MGCCMGRRSRPLLHDQDANDINVVHSHYQKVVEAIKSTIKSANYVVQKLKAITSELESYHGILNTAQNVSFVAGMAGAAGVAVTAFTAGFSLTATAAAVAAAGTAGNIGLALVGDTVSGRLLDEASTALDKYESEEENLQSLYQQFESKCEEVYWHCSKIIRRNFQVDDVIRVICQTFSHSAFVSASKGLIDAVGTELKSQLAAAKGATAVLPGAFVFATAATVNISFKKLLNDSFSEAEKKVKEATEQLEKRKEQLERLREKVQTHA